MKLTELKGFNINVNRDRDFTSLGYLPYRTSKMLVYIEDEKFISQINPKYTSCVIAKKEFSKKIPKNYGLVTNPKPMETFFKIHDFLANHNFYPEILGKIHPTVIIHESAVIAKNVQIGENSQVEANVCIFPNTKIGNNVIIRSGTVIGSSGFEYKRLSKSLLSVPHAGGVEIKDEVEVKANCCIDRAIFGGFTRIGKSTKIDKSVNISHNTSIGERCMIITGAIVNGSCDIGNDVYIGPGAIISNSLKIGDGAFISLGAVVVKDVEENAKVTGNFAINHNKFLNYLIKNDLI